MDLGGKINIWHSFCPTCGKENVKRIYDACHELGGNDVAAKLKDSGIPCGCRKQARPENRSQSRDCLMGMSGTLKDYSYLVQGQMAFNYGTYSKAFYGMHFDPSNKNNGWSHTDGSYCLPCIEGRYAPWSMCLNPSIDFTPFKEIVLRSTDHSGTYNNKYVSPYIGVASAKRDDSPTIVRSKTYGDTFEDLRLNVSDLSGHHFIWIGFRSSILNGSFLVYGFPRKPNRISCLIKMKGRLKM